MSTPEPHIEIQGDPLKQAIRSFAGPPGVSPLTPQLMTPEERMSQITAPLLADATKPGKATSELKLTLVSHLVAVVMFVLGLFAHFPPEIHDTLRVALLAVGGFLMGGGQLAYTAARTALKKQVVAAAGDGGADDGGAD